MVPFYIYHQVVSEYIYHVGYNKRLPSVLKKNNETFFPNMWTNFLKECANFWESPFRKKILNIFVPNEGTKFPERK